MRDTRLSLGDAGQHHAGVNPSYGEEDARSRLVGDIPREISIGVEGELESIDVVPYPANQAIVESRVDIFDQPMEILVALAVPFGDFSGQGTDSAQEV